MVDRLVASAMDEPESRSVEAPESAPEDSGGADAQAPSAPAGVRVIQREPRKRRRPGTGPPRSPDPGSYGDALAAEVEALHEIGEHEVVPPSVPEPEAAPSVPEVEAPAERVEIEQPEMPVAEEAQETPAEEQVEDALGALFSRLRGDSAEAEAAADVETRLPEDTDTEVAVVVAAEKEETSAVLTEPLELRERLLLPVQNSALREVKRSLLDLQNEALDTLRVSGAWHPNVDTVGDGLGSALESAVGSAAEAGADAVNELSGKARPSAVITARTSVMAALMAEDLCAQLDTALAEIDRAGPVEASSTLSRVFRAWRSDEAERWVRTVTYAAYHDSLLAGLSFSGIELVEGLAHGRLCEECPAAGGEPWDPAGDPPAGTAPPPAHLDCTCSVVPRL